MGLIDGLEPWEYITPSLISVATAWLHGMDEQIGMG